MEAEIWIVYVITRTMDSVQCRQIGSTLDADQTYVDGTQQSPMAIKTVPACTGWNEWGSSINESIYNREWSPLASDSSTNLLLRMGGNFQISTPVDRFGKRNMLRDCNTSKLPFTLYAFIELESNI